MIETQTHDSHGRQWIDDDIVELSELLLAGKTIRQIAATVDRPQEAIRPKAQMLDLPPEPAERRSVDEALSRAALPAIPLAWSIPPA